MDIIVKIIVHLPEETFITAVDVNRLAGIRSGHEMYGSDTVVKRKLLEIVIGRSPARRCEALARFTFTLVLHAALAEANLAQRRANLKRARASR